jgi:hypothetical protein
VPLRGDNNEYHPFYSLILSRLAPPHWFFAPTRFVLLRIHIRPLSVLPISLPPQAQGASKLVVIPSLLLNKIHDSLDMESGVVSTP